MSNEQKKEAETGLKFRSPTGGEIIDFYKEIDEKEDTIVSYARAAALLADVDLEAIRALGEKEFWAALAKGKAAFFPNDL